MNHLVDKIIETVTLAGMVEVLVSVPHVCLTRADIRMLFGEGRTFHAKRPLAQKGTYLCREQVNLTGSGGSKENVAVFAPVCEKTQVELSAGDVKELGIIPVQEDSLRTGGTGVVTIEGPCGVLTCGTAVKVMKNHIKVSPEIALKLHLHEQQRVSVELITDSRYMIHDVEIQVQKQFRFRMYIDPQTAKAAAINGFTLGRIIFPG